MVFTLRSTRDWTKCEFNDTRTCSTLLSVMEDSLVPISGHSPVSCIVKLPIGAIGLQLE
ncbi:hypothetical protein J6590_011435 [Homalodisca vitripennis]|nr:hypothetical protein J6590_011435 [Homalodisca vitripennis]